MKNIKLLHAVFLISGTAIGAGLIALPLVTVNLGIYLSVLIIALMVFVAYQSSMMTIELNERNKEAASIIKLSERTCIPRVAAVLSFCTLSFALLMVYISALAESLGVFFGVNHDFWIVFCGILLFMSLNFRRFQNINSTLVAVLLLIICVSVVKIHANSGTTVLEFCGAHVSLSEVIAFLPIGFTSFGVQNICPHIYKLLDGNRKQISRAFIIGIIIPAIVYVVWIYCVFENIATRDVLFFERLQNHQVSVGELIQFLCASSDSVFMKITLKVLSMFAIATSAIGCGLGLRKSLQEMMHEGRYSHKISSMIVCFVPILVGIIIPNAFINVLSFGGMIATVFVIFVPYYLLRINGHFERAYDICFVCGVIIVLCELARYIS